MITYFPKNTALRTDVVQKKLWLKSSVCSVFARAAYRWELLNLRQYTGLVTGWAHSWKYCPTHTG